MSYKLVLDNTKKIELILNNMGAQGKGLYEKSLSVEDKLESSILKSIRFLATIRNKLLHEENFILEKKTKLEFINKSNEVIETLVNKQTKRKKQNYCNVTNDHLDKQPYLFGNKNKQTNVENTKSEKNNNPIFIAFSITVIIVILVKNFT